MKEPTRKEKLHADHPQHGGVHHKDEDAPGKQRQTPDLPWNAPQHLLPAHVVAAVQAVIERSYRLRIVRGKGPPARTASGCRQSPRRRRKLCGRGDIDGDALNLNLSQWPPQWSKPWRTGQGSISTRGISVDGDGRKAGFKGNAQTGNAH